MPVSLLKTRDTESVLHFPLGGINVSSPFGKQPNVPIDKDIGWYARTTPLAINVRGSDQLLFKDRGGSRAGLDRLISARFPGVILGLNTVVGVGYADPGGGVQSSNSGRLVDMVVVCNGNIRIASMGSDNYVTPTNGNGALNSSGLSFSAQNGGKLFFADGTHTKYYQPSDNTVHDWVLEEGEFPHVGANYFRLIATWQGRTVTAGLEDDPQNWFATAIGNPNNFNYFPTEPLATQAVQGGNSSLGKIGDVITAIIPFSDDICIFGGDHTIEALQGNPADGGRRIEITDGIGIAWGAAWCRDPYGNLYFFSNRTGIYKIDPQSPRPNPVRISQAIEPLLATVNTGSNTICMAWDDRWQGFHTFVTRTAGPAAAVHLFYEARTNAWFMDKFTDPMNNPLCCCTIDGNTADDRVVVLGSWNGYVNWLNPAATKDVGVAIASSVVIGPLLTNDIEEIMAIKMQAVFGETTIGPVKYEIFTGKTAEKALSSSPALSGFFGVGRNFTVPVMRSGNAIYLKLSATTPWAMEKVKIALKGLGLVLGWGA